MILLGTSNVYVVRAWKDEQDMHTIVSFSYKSHDNLIPSLFTYLNSFSSIPLNENKGSLVNGVPKIKFKRIRQMI
jgi:hypothetical protein